MGSRVEEISCPREVDPDKLELGQLYELGYSHFRVKGQLCARVISMQPVEG